MAWALRVTGTQARGLHRRYHKFIPSISEHFFMNQSLPIHSFYLKEKNVLTEIVIKIYEKNKRKRN